MAGALMWGREYAKHHVVSRKAVQGTVASGANQGGSQRFRLDFRHLAQY